MKTARLLVAILSVAGILFIVGKTNGQADITVYDADDQFLGILYEASNHTGIFIPSLGKIVSISLYDGNMYDSSMYFVSDDCTGVPYSGPVLLHMIVKNGDKYYTGENVPPTNIDLNSYLGTKGTCHRSVNTKEFIPLQEVNQPPLILPVSLPLSYEYEPPHPGKWKK